LIFENGKALEIEAIWGEPLRRAAAAGTPTPRLEILYSLLKSLDQARQRAAGPTIDRYESRLELGCSSRITVRNLQRTVPVDVAALQEVRPTGFASHVLAFLEMSRRN